MSDPYISRKEVNTSYRPQSGLMSPGLQRARAPFRVRNAITGLVLAGFATGVWAYSISAVKQDDFSDIDEEAKVLHVANANSSSNPSSSAAQGQVVDVSGEEEKVAVVLSAVDDMSVGARREEVTKVARRTRGLLARAFEGRSWGERVLDPTSRTFVWGAPPVDNIGRIGDRTSRK
ncbi:hypothetical protein BXZ70DRAFT_1032552 [Cristinia sonorae]|uniref:Cytochrome c oxidase assembly factor 3 n=1 Tax=Cristinia sonorae TaxID=1940300 RepID=A0A8K0UMB9_9AGAR|nr:hypothetical protein BXZ70DRAFT_1032552 [Cristinia sonorae]